MLVNGESVMLDPEDEQFVYKWAWRLNNSGYACRESTENGKRVTILMHRMLLGLNRGDPAQVDHINGVKTDNRRCNLRLATKKENRRNIGALSNNKSGFKGVHFAAYANKWRADILENGKRRYLGYYNTPEEAHAAYCVEAERLHGEFKNFGRSKA